MNEDKKSKKKYLYDDNVSLTKYAKKKLKKNLLTQQSLGFQVQNNLDKHEKSNIQVGNNLKNEIDFQQGIESVAIPNFHELVEECDFLHLSDTTERDNVLNSDNQMITEKVNIEKKNSMCMLSDDLQDNAHGSDLSIHDFSNGIQDNAAEFNLLLDEIPMSREYLTSSEISRSDFLCSSDEEVFTAENARPSKIEELQNEKEFLESVSTMVNKSPGEILLMVLKYSVKHKLSFTAMVGLLEFVNQLCGKKVVPETRYAIDKLCKVVQNVTFHSICPKCSNYLGKFNSGIQFLSCTNCNLIVNVSSMSKPSFFVLIDSSDAISDCLQQYEHYFDFVIKERKHKRNYIQDIFDGKAYKKFRKNLSSQDRYSYVSAILNTDGAPVFKSSNYSIWPLYIMLNEIPAQARFDNIILIGLWYGKKKPVMSVILELVVQFVNNISTVGISCKINEKEISLKLFIILACVDTIARAPMNGSSQFNASYGCDWCEHPGQHYQGSMRYPYLHQPSKERDQATTIQYAEQALTKTNPVYGIKSASPLINLNNFDIITGFCPDYMHCLLAGVTSQFTEYFLRDMSKDDIGNLDSMLSKQKVPHQISRLSRGIKDRRNWKCREWENWALYYSLPLLSRFSISIERLNHWSLFVQSLYLSLQSCITYDQLNHIDALINRFVSEVESLYTLKAMTYNVHQMLHIPKSIANWGPLWAHSAFQFESANCKLLCAIHAANGVILQVIRHINIQRYIKKLEQIVYPNCSEIVIEYCENLVTKNSKNVVKTNVRTYFGKEIIIEPYYVKNLNISRSSKIFLKMAHERCLYSSARKINVRSRNDFVQLKNRQFVQIIDFLVDLNNESEISMCKIIETRPNRYSSTVNEIISISNVISAIPTADIDKVCVYLEDGNYSCVIPVVNLFWY